MKRLLDCRVLMALALPIVLSRLGNLSLELVDAMVVGRLGADDLAAVGLGGAVFWFFAVSIGGFLLPIDAMASRAFGEGRDDEAHNVLTHGLILGGLVSAVATGIMILISFHLDWLNVTAQIEPVARSFLFTLAPSLPFAVVLTIFNLFWQSRRRAGFIVWMMVGANVVNLLGDQALVYGWWGAPRLGAAGSALATLIVRVLMVLFVLYKSHRLYNGHFFSMLKSTFRPDRTLLRNMLKQGTMSAGQSAADVGAFSLVSLIMVKFGSAVMATHYIVLRLVSFFYMVPVGISQATSVRVAFAVGQNQRREARYMGNSGIILGAAIMAGAAVLILLFRRQIVGLFSTDAEIIAAASQLMICVGTFQIFDGVSACTGGALRGIGNTGVAMRANIIGFYAIGIPVGYLLSQHLTNPALGMWCGLALSLAVAATISVMNWLRLAPEP